MQKNHPNIGAIEVDAVIQVYLGRRVAAQLRSQISSLGQQLSSFRGNTTSPEASALLNQQAVLKEQLAQMQVSGAVDTGDVVLVTPAQTPTSPSSPKPAQDALLGFAAGLAGLNVVAGGVFGWALVDLLPDVVQVITLAQGPDYRQALCLRMPETAELTMVIGWCMGVMQSKVMHK